MARLNLIVMSLLIAGSASAFPMFCKGKYHKVSINSNGRLAQVYDRNDEPVIFGKMRCTTIFSLEVRPEGSPIVACNTSQSVADAGLSVYVYRPLGTNKYLGRLSTQSIMGPKVIDSLKCVMAMHE